MKLLLIEDNPDHAELIMNAFKSFDVEHVSSGEEGLKKVSEKNYDLILLDYRLPDMDGIQFLDKVKEIPVILMSGMGSESVAVQALKGGAYDYITKSVYDLQRLPIVVKQSIEQYRIKKEKEILEKSLRDTKNYLDSIIAASADGIVVTDSNGNIILFNKAAEELTGFASEEVKGKTEDFYFDKRELKKITKHLVNYGKLTNQRVEILTKHSKQIHASLSTSLLKDNDGKVTGTVKIYRDVTAEVETQRRLSELYYDLYKAHDKLQELDKLKTNFMRRASHELRSPLTPIIGYVDILKKEDLSKKQMRYIEIIERNAYELNKLAGELIELIRHDSGKTWLEKEIVHLPGLVNEIIENLNPPQKVVRNVADITIEADRRKLSQVFSNLVSNANKYTPDNGEIRIEVIDKDKNIEAKVSDTGMGIGEKDMPYIFDKFYTADAPLTRKQGLGIGLSIAKANVELHGGKIRVESAIGKGSTFYFIIPK